jgi:AraC-like DNA-binding protein
VAVFETRDLDAARRFIGQQCPSVQLSKAGDSKFLRITTDTIGPVRLEHIECMMKLRYAAGPVPALVIGYIAAGMLYRETAGAGDLLGPGDLFLLSHPGQPHVGRTDDTVLQLTVLDPSLLHHVASTSPTRAPIPLQFTSFVPVSAGAARHYRQTVDYLRDNLLGNPDAAAQPLIIGSATRLLAASALACFPNTAVTDPTAHDRHDASPATVRRAVAFIEENADSDISVADVAASACVTVRAVQLAFRRHLDTTPMAYLRRVRLEHAHAELGAADPRGGLTVTTVAARWGFPSPSRFTTYYRRAYGVTPSHTLHGRDRVAV